MKPRNKGIPDWPKHNDIKLDDTQTDRLNMLRDQLYKISYQLKKTDNKFAAERTVRSLQEIVPEVKFDAESPTFWEDAQNTLQVYRANVIKPQLIDVFKQGLKQRVPEADDITVGALAEAKFESESAAAQKFVYRDLPRERDTKRVI